jgi:multidrug efflux pump subunit AcrB
MNRMPSPIHGGGLAAWSIRHPIGVSMIAAAVVVLGLFALGRLSVDLLPHLIYPEIRVRILDPGVPASVMEDSVTRQLEEQLAITEGAISVQSRSNEGASSVDLTFEYGTDIDRALRDASTRLDRAKRFLPDTIDPPVIYKRDPSQIPVAEFVVSSASLDTVKLRDWVDYDFSKQFLNLPGVASVEVGGGTVREILVEPNQQRLAAVGIGITELIDTMKKNNVELPAGRLTMAQQELSSRTAARFRSVDELRQLPIVLRDGSTLPLEQLARIHDGHSDERIKVRLNGTPGIKVAIQKQPSANTVAVVDAVNQRMEELKRQGLIPADMTVEQVSDQAVFVRNALNNAGMAALSGTLLAMIVVYLFLGDLRRTLIIGSAIPLAVMVTFSLMGAGGLTFNIMTLGGLALGVGMLVDNTIVMLENIQRHQQAGEEGLEAGTAAASEINSAIVAATSTNLAAVLPFLFIGGLIGLLFRELIFTISAAIVASMIVALTLVPALAVRVKGHSVNRVSRTLNHIMLQLQEGYSRLLGGLLKRRSLQLAIISTFLGALALSLFVFGGAKQAFLPQLDTGEISISISADPGIALEQMDREVRKMEQLLQAQPGVRSVFTLVGGFIFGRTERESSNRTTITVQLVPREQRKESSDQWIRGIRLSSGDDDISLRLQGPDMTVLYQLGDQIVKHLQGTEGLRNLQHSAEEVRQELSLRLKRERLAQLGLDAETVGRILQLALEGEVVSDFLDNDRSYDIRMRLPRNEANTPEALQQLVLRNAVNGQSLRLSEIAHLELIAAPAEIRRDRQLRIVEVSASLGDGTTYGEVQQRLSERLADFSLPSGYSLYDGGEFESLQQGRRMSQLLLGLALFLVFVVMAVQYESLRNPVVILLGVPFSVIGVGLGLLASGLPLSMPVWLGLIMLAGIVVNNAIILVEYMDIARGNGMSTDEAIIEAARLRLRPILMTTLTTVVGMAPLALGWGEGAEMLQPLAVSLISGLSMSLLVTLVLIPMLYRTTHSRA